MTTTLERPTAKQSDPPVSGLALLRVPFPPEKIGKLPKAQIKSEDYKQLAKAHCDICGGYHPTTATIHLDFVGHADVTERLLDVDPEWNWEPMATSPDGTPMMTLNNAGQPIGLWIKLTVCGVTRIGFGSVTAGAFDAEKQLIGDALRNAAMRFGVALDLWRKEKPDETPQHHSAPRAATGAKECPFCKDMGYVNSRGGPSVYFQPSKGPMAGQWQCNGRTDERNDEGIQGWANHPLPLVEGEEVNDPSEIPFS